MIDVSVISSYTHCIESRTIQLIDVIESWKLDRHLACVVKYIEIGSYKRPTLGDLKKAAWYLERAGLKENHSHQNKFRSQQTQLECATYSPQAVCDDWDLSDRLCSTLINIFLSRGCSSYFLKAKVLNAALGYLREEIMFLEQEQYVKLPFRIFATR